MSCLPWGTCPTPWLLRFCDSTEPLRNERAHPPLAHNHLQAEFLLALIQATTVSTTGEPSPLSTSHLQGFLYRCSSTSTELGTGRETSTQRSDPLTLLCACLRSLQTRTQIHKDELVVTPFKFNTDATFVEVILQHLCDKGIHCNFTKLADHYGDEGFR